MRMSTADRIVFWLFLLPFGIIIWLMVIASVVAAALGLWSAS